MRRRISWSVALAAVSLLTALAVAGAAADPFAFFAPTVVLTDDDRRALERGDAVARTLPGGSGTVGVFAAVRVNADGDRLVAWTRNISALKKSSYVDAIGRFSDPPRLGDLEGLGLDDEELQAIQQCRPGDCDLKLTAAEMQTLHEASAGAGEDSTAALQMAFRQIVLQRVQHYLAGGHAALDDYADGEMPVSLGNRFQSVLARSPFLTDRMPRFAAHLEGYPNVPIDGVETFIYWSKERLGGKPIISATHVSILRGGDGLAPDAMVAGKGIFATHYINATLGITAIVRNPAESAAYLVYLNRSDVDLVRGFFGALVRSFMERRLRREASDVLVGLRQRLEGGEPPPVGRRAGT